MSSHKPTIDKLIETYGKIMYDDGVWRKQYRSPDAVNAETALREHVKDLESSKLLIEENRFLVVTRLEKAIDTLRKRVKGLEVAADTVRCAVKILCETDHGEVVDLIAKDHPWMDKSIGGLKSRLEGSDVSKD